MNYSNDKWQIMSIKKIGLRHKQFLMVIVYCL
jgi:hypothetical protein